MFSCNMCENVKISPEYAESSNHKYIQLKNNRIIHVFHLKQLSDFSNSNTNSSKLNSNQIFTTQPMPTKIASLSSEINSYKNYADLVQSSKFKQSQLGNLNYRMGYDTMGFSMIFKNMIKLNETISNQNLRNNMTSHPVLFFIHGVGGNYKIWDSQIKFFHSIGYEVVAIDLLGHGESKVLNESYNYQFLELALDCLLVFDMFAKQDNILIGHSYGCSFATYLAQSRSNISKLILISGGSPHPLEYNSMLLKMPLCLIQMMKPLLYCKFYCSAFSSYCKLPQNSNEAFNISSKVLFYTMKGQNWRAANEAFHSTIRQKVLLIEGQDDKFVPIEDALDMIKILKYGYLVVLSKGSHMIIMEQHEIINNLINLFLNDSFT